MTTGPLVPRWKFVKNLTDQLRYRADRALGEDGVVVRNEGFRKEKLASRFVCV